MPEPFVQLFDCVDVTAHRVLLHVLEASPSYCRTQVVVVEESHDRLPQGRNVAWPTQNAAHAIDDEIFVSTHPGCDDRARPRLRFANHRVHDLVPQRRNDDHPAAAVALSNFARTEPTGISDTRVVPGFAPDCLEQLAIPHDTEPELRIGDLADRPNEFTKPTS